MYVPRNAGTTTGDRRNDFADKTAAAAAAHLPRVFVYRNNNNDVRGRHTRYKQTTNRRQRLRPFSLCTTRTRGACNNFGIGILNNNNTRDLNNNSSSSSCGGSARTIRLSPPGPQRFRPGRPPSPCKCTHTKTTSTVHSDDNENCRRRVPTRCQPRVYPPVL